MTGWHIFPLELFPQGSISSSIITTVWIGIFVAVFFNLRFGWALSGFIVPGYLAPMAMSKPWNAAAVVVEAIITYFIAIILGALLNKLRGTSEFFGRDRFFLLLLTSVFVRIGFDGYIFPAFVDYADRVWHTAIDYHGDLQSYGLIIIALIANQFWKPKLLRGMFSLFITCAVTFLLIRYMLMPLTNFSLSNLAYMYESSGSTADIAAKSYIILLTAAFIASRLNLIYAWDFNGILMPALLALHWYEPKRIFITFIEAFIIFGISKIVLRTSYFASTNIEGARKMLLFFNISFILNIIVGFFIQWFFPEKHIIDYFGVGYLLSTLIAIKIHDKNNGIKTTIATLSAVVVSVLIASVIGFMLTFLSPAAIKTIAEPTINNNQLAASLEETSEPLENFLKTYKDLIAKEASNSYKTADIATLNYFDKEVLSPLYHFINNKQDLSQLQPIAAKAAAVGYRLVKITNNEAVYIVLAEKISDNMSHSGSYVFSLKNGTNYIVAAPKPLADSGSFKTAESLFEQLGAAVLCIAGAHPKANDNGDADVASMKNKTTLFNLVHQVWLRESGASPLQIVHIRNYKAGTNNGIIIASTQRQPSAELERLQGNLVSSFKDTPFKIANGDIATAGFEVPVTPMLAYAQVAENKGFSVIWQPPAFMNNYNNDDEYYSRNTDFAAAGIQTKTGDVKKILAQSQFIKAGNKLQSLAAEYLKNRDIITLKSMLAEYNIQHVFDNYSEQSYLIFSDKNGNVAMAMNLAPLDNNSIIENKPLAIETFLKNRVAILTGARP